jgi:hypothetical protein
MSSFAFDDVFIVKNSRLIRNTAVHACYVNRMYACLCCYLLQQMVREIANRMSHDSDKRVMMRSSGMNMRCHKALL